MTNERQITEDDVREEHLRSVNSARHWIYLFGVMGAGFLLMVALIAVLGSGSG